MSLVIGVDVGGTKVVVSPLGSNGLGESVLGTNNRSGSRALIDQIVAMVNRTRGDDLESVGIGVPSTVEFETGLVVSSANIPLVDVPLRQVLGKRLGVPVFVDNDATVADRQRCHHRCAVAGATLRAAAAALNELPDSTKRTSSSRPANPSLHLPSSMSGPPSEPQSSLTEASVGGRTLPLNRSQRT
jgi:hypothetical protein